MSGNSRKRSRPSSEDANNSFVSAVTSKVTGLLPAKITQWFSRSKSSQTNSNGSAPTAEVTDSSSEEEPEMLSPIIQPPQKRVRYNSSDHYNSNETNCVTYNNESAMASSFNMGLGPSHIKKFAGDSSLVSGPIRTSNEVSSPDRSERDGNITNSSLSHSRLGPPVSNKRQSLFQNNDSWWAKSTNSTMVDSKQPIKPRLLSPFYPSRTSYGGALSQYINQPNIKQRKVTQVKETIGNNVTTMSQSSRRVMELLEDYSSPMKEAKRLPHTPPSNGPLETSSPYSLLSNSFSDNLNKSLSPLTHEFRAPNIASILRLKQKSRLMNTTNVARQIIASHSSAGRYSPYTSPNGRSQSDVESRSKCVGTTSDSQSQTWTENTESPTLPPVSLPTAVLQISKDNMPKFTFGTNSVVSSTPKPITSKTDNPVASGAETPVSVAPKTTRSKPEISTSKDSVDSGETFTFSRPVKIPFTVGSPQEATTPSKFTFGSPDRTIDKTNQKIDKSICVVGEKDDVQTEIPKLKDWECSDCWVKNKQNDDKCVCCGGKKPSSTDDKNVKCSVCKLAKTQPNKDECVNCEKFKKKEPTSNNFNNTPLLNSVSSTKWKCNDCWVDNDESKEKCVCCGSKNPKKSAPSTPAAPAKVVTDNDWTCNDCWIKNKSSVEKCVACGGAKPGSKQSNKALPMSLTPTAGLKPLDNKPFKPLVDTQSKKWECVSCLVRNDDDKIKCVCCETERPGTEKKIPKTTFNFGSPSANTFKFGIDPKVQEANLSKAKEIKPLETKVEESETNNNVLPKAPPTFSFGIPAKKADDQTDNTINKAPAPVNESPLVAQKTSMFKVPDFIAKKPEVKEDNEKPQEVPKVDFSLPAPTSKPESKPFGSLGASPLTLTPKSTMFTMPASAPSSAPSSTPSSAPSSTPSLLNPTANVEKKDAPTPQLPFQLNPNTDAATPAQNKFTFSGAGLKPAMNLFNKPASSPPTTSISFGSPAQSTPTTVSSLFQKPPEQTATSMPLFQKSDAPTNSPLSLFQKPTATATTTAPSLASTAPVFSFGTTAKPAATFNFGATQPANMNESTANSSFTFFGSTPDKNASTNKFNLGGVTNLGSGGLSTGNALGGHNISGVNSLASEMPVQSNQNDQVNSIQSPTSNIFGSHTQKENIWSQSNNTTNNLFGANASNNLQKPAAFTFGSSSTAFGAQSGNPAATSTPFGAQPSNSASSSTPFGAQPSNPVNSSTPFGAQSSNPVNSSTPFGAQPSNPAPSSTPFGAQPSNSAPVFGSNAQPQNLFGMGNQSSNSRSLFSNQSQPAPNLFGASQNTSSPNVMGMFGASAAGTATSFGAPAQSMPTFDQSAIAPAPQPAFNFGAAPSQTPVVFGFGQQQQAQQQQQPVYNFGTSTNSPQMGMGAAPQVQFNMGSAPPVRRVRKAVRRNTPR